MSDAMFRIGGTYRQKNGEVVTLREPRSARDTGGRALGWAVYASGIGSGHRFLDTGEEWDEEMLHYNRDLLPGDLPFEAPSMTPTLDKLEAQEPKRAPLAYFTERTRFDPFEGFTSSSYQVLPDSFAGTQLAPEQRLADLHNPLHGSACLKG